VPAVNNYQHRPLATTIRHAKDQNKSRRRFRLCRLAWITTSKWRENSVRKPIWRVINPKSIV